MRNTTVESEPSSRTPLTVTTGCAVVVGFALCVTGTERVGKPLAPLSTTMSQSPSTCPVDLSARHDMRRDGAPVAPQNSAGML
jgi:hypothetical protein